MAEFITSKDNKRIKELVKLGMRPSPDRFVIEGYHAIEVAFTSHHLKEVYCLEDPHLPNIPTYVVNEAILKKVSKANTFEKIIGVASIETKKEYGNRVLILDRLQDPGNIGTLLRTAASFGFEDVVFLKGTCSPFNYKAVASCEGALFHANLHFESGIDCIQSLKQQGFHIFGSALRNAKPLENCSLKHEKIGLILGNEGQGMSEELLSITDENIKISMQTMESLNVGIAGGILMHAIFSTR